MSLFNLSFLSRQKKDTASTAKERLQILVAHDRASKASADLMPVLQREILEVVRRHLSVEKEKVDVRMDRGQDSAMLEINIELPNAKKFAVAGHA